MSKEWFEDINKIKRIKIDGEWIAEVPESVLKILLEQAKQTQKYKNVIKHLKNTHHNFCVDDNKQVEWVSGWGAAIDFIEENLDWEETDEARTIVEQNKRYVEYLKQIRDEGTIVKNEVTGKRYLDKCGQIADEALEESK